MPGDLLALLAARAAAGRPLRVGLIGAGKLGMMFLAQARRLTGLHLLGVADQAPETARAAMLRAGWPEAQLGAASLGEALASGATHVGADAAALIAAGGLDVVVEATGVPAAGIAHCLLAIDYGRQIVMASPEADALAGPILARRAADAGLVYSLAYGSRPALLAELVQWARACGLEVTCAGAGARYLPAYRSLTPDTVAEHAGLDHEQVALGDYSPRLLCSSLDGTRAAIEMATVANACGLTPQPDGLRFPPCGVEELPHLLRPEAEGGALAHAGTVEIVSSLWPDGTPVERNLLRGVCVTFAAPDDYMRRAFAEHGLLTDESGRYGALTRPCHLGGIELAVSVLRAGLRGEPTGSPAAFSADVAAVAKRDLAEGELLDGEGGAAVYGALMPAAAALAGGCLPIGLAAGVALRHPVLAGQTLTWNDVLYEPTNPTVRMRRLMERTFRP